MNGHFNMLNAEHIKNANGDFEIMEENTVTLRSKDPIIKMGRQYQITDTFCWVVYFLSSSGDLYVCNTFPSPLYTGRTTKSLDIPVKIGANVIDFESDEKHLLVLVQN